MTYLLWGDNLYPITNRYEENDYDKDDISLCK